MKKRKGARWLDIGLERWSYYRGERFVEIRGPDGQKALVARAILDEPRLTRCSCGSHPSDCNFDSAEVQVTLPGAVARYIRENLRP